MSILQDLGDRQEKESFTERNKLSEVSSKEAVPLLIPSDSTQGP